MCHVLSDAPPFGPPLLITFHYLLGDFKLVILPFIRRNHRCTVAGNPGWGVLGFFWQILLRGVLGVVRKSGGGSRFVAFLCGTFSKIFIGGT